MKSHTNAMGIQVITNQKRPWFLALALLFVGLWPTFSHAERRSPPEPPCENQICYGCNDHQRLMNRVSELISCKQKLAKRDKALAKIKRTVNDWKERDTRRKKKIQSLIKERDTHRAQKEKAARELHKAWTIFWSVTGSILVVSAVTIVALAVTRPNTASQTSPVRPPPGPLDTIPHPLAINIVKP